MGIAFKSPLADLRESVEILRRLLAGERLDFHGERFHLDKVQLEFWPQERVPIVLGVKGPRARAMAGEIADGVLGSILSSPAHVRRLREAGAHRPAFTVAAYTLMLIDDDGARARDRLKPMLAHYLGILHGQSILADAGLGADRTLPFREALLRGEDARHLVTDEMVDTLAVVGSPAECRQRLRSFTDAGLDTLIAVAPRSVDLTQQIARIGTELLPAWKEMRCR
jgi:5,10-methylenetetrahydromethanopterin reductase